MSSSFIGSMLAGHNLAQDSDVESRVRAQVVSLIYWSTPAARQVDRSRYMLLVAVLCSIQHIRLCRGSPLLGQCAANICRLEVSTGPGRFLCVLPKLSDRRTVIGTSAHPFGSARLPSFLTLLLRRLTFEMPVTVRTMPSHIS